MRFFPMLVLTDCKCITVNFLNCKPAVHRLLSYHSHSTNTNQFYLEIIFCHIRGAFDYLMYPYYPAYIS